MSEPIFRLSGIVRTFKQGRSNLEILRGLDLDVSEGEIVGLIGPSGSGKSTLLHIAGLLERPDAGEVTLAGSALSDRSDDERTRARRVSMGFVYQFHHLLPEFTALENVVIPQLIAGLSRREAGSRAEELLRTLGLGDRLQHRPARLSGGEQQRVAIARALANRPQVVFADEPTGNLDPNTSSDVFALLLSIARQAGLAALIATHNPALAERMDRVVALEDGVLVPA